MKKIFYTILYATSIFYLTGCEEEKPINFTDDKTTVEDYNIVTGTKWKNPIPTLDDKVDAMIVFEDKLYLTYLYSNSGSFAYSGEFNGTRLTHLSQNMGNSSGFNKFRVYDKDLYLIGNAGYYAVWKYNKGREEHENPWESDIYANTPYNDYIIVDGNDYGATSIPPYLRVSGGVDVGSGFDKAIYALQMYRSDLYCAGSFTKADGNSVRGVARWDGDTWVQLGDGLDGSVSQMIVYKNQLIVLGDFKKAGNLTVNNIAAWDGKEWSSLGTGLNAGNGRGGALYEHADELIVGGFFDEAGGEYSPYIAKWDGTKWIPLPPGVPEAVGSIAVFENQLYISNAFQGSSNYLLRLE